MNKINLLKYVALIILQCSLFTTLVAQTAPAKQWDKRFGGTNFDALFSLKQTMDGGYILGGYSDSDSSGDKTQNSWNQYVDYWVVKTDINGVKQWDKRFGGDEMDELYCLQQTVDGGYILGGWSASSISGDKTQDTWGVYVYWVVKINSNGVKQWDKRFGTGANDLLFSVEQTLDGGYILGGYTASGISGDKTQASRGVADYWIVKIDGNGVKQWDKRFGGSADDNLYSLHQTMDGGYILGGYSASRASGDKTDTSRGGMDYWIVKIDGNGVKQWDKTFGGNGDDKLSCLEQTIDGGYILGGSSASGIGGDKTEVSRGNVDYWLIKTDVNGIKQWDKRFGGTAEDILSSLQQTTDGGYVLTGSSLSDSNGDKTQGSQGDYDDWVVKIDANGIKQWDARFGGTAGDWAESTQQTTDGGYIVGGRSDSDSSGDRTQANWGIADYWIIKIACTPPKAKITPLSSLDICVTGSVVLRANGGIDLSYQWKKNGNDIVGARNRKYTATATGTYKVVVTGNPGCSKISKGVTVTNSCGIVARTNKISSGELSISTTQLSLYPNPSKGIITATYNSNRTTAIQLTVFEETGKAVFSTSQHAVTGNNIYKLSLSNLSPGIYYLQLNTASGQNHVKFIIQK